MTSTTAQVQDPYGTIPQLWNVVKHSQPQISFWGSRYIQCANGETLPLAALLHRVLDLSHPLEIDHMPMEQRILGVLTLERLHEFYQETDILIAKANIITRASSWIRNFSAQNL